MEERVKELLNRILHPETQHGLVESGFVEQVSTPGDKITVTLNFAKVRDPFALKIKRQVQALLEENFPALKGSITVIIKEAAPKKPQAADKPTMTGDIAHIVAIASGKGGVGKSTVTANLAVALRNRGFRVGILDADIYGPSQPKMFGLEGYLPEAEQVDGQDIILPAETMDMKIMSIGFFVKPSDALLWRGAMAVNALRQMIHQTRWGALDFLLVDLPPGTGDIHLSIISELKIDTAVIVSTPQQIAVADVRRGVEMFRNPQVNIPLAGIVENMAWFTPEELPETRFLESYRQMFKTGFDISTCSDYQHSLLFFRAYPESYFAKTFFCRFLVLSIPGERWILQTVPGFSFQKLLRVYQHRSWGYLTTLSTIRSAISR